MSRIGGVNAVAAHQRRGHQRQQLVSRVRPPRRIPEVEVTVNERAGPGWPEGAAQHC